MESFYVAVFQFIVLIFSVVIHEVSHGFVAERLGDPTARQLGRLTLNPIKHIDPMGSVFLPLLLVLTGSPIVIGWAKPVPYDPRHLKDPVRGGAQIAAAGPLSNILVAIVFGLFLRGFVAAGYSPVLPPAAFFSVIVYINILLAIFNLLPIPPLDGSKVLYAILPKSEQSYHIVSFLERYGFFLLLLFIFFGFGLILPIVEFLYVLIAG